MYKLKTKAHFDSAHFLSGYNGKCSNIHGHRWEIEAILKSSELIEDGEKRGMLIDFSDFKKAVKEIADSFDHSFIYESGTIGKKLENALKEEGFRIIPVEFRPTAENFAKYFFDEFKNRNFSIESVTVYETPENCAVYMEE